MAELLPYQKRKILFDTAKELAAEQDPVKKKKIYKKWKSAIMTLPKLHVNEGVEHMYFSLDEKAYAKQEAFRQNKIVFNTMLPDGTKKLSIRL